MGVIPFHFVAEAFRSPQPPLKRGARRSRVYQAFRKMVLGKDLSAMATCFASGTTLRVYVKFVC
jgi:hypothetical protein